jgi:NAD-dependent SIR2 family protein deacetylase
LEAKVKLLVRMMKASNELCLYTGAGLSTAAGIGDYASKAAGSIVQKESQGNRLNSEPTYSHRVLAALEKVGVLKHWLQQNHDGLAQKAGYPIEKLNEIHGSWYDRNNPVVQMDGTLRPDLFEWMMEWKDKADCCIAMGTSLCGMHADCVAASVSQRFMQAGSGAGLVIINLQHTDMDDAAQLRIYATIDAVMRIVVKKMRLTLDKETYSAYTSVARRRNSKIRSNSRPRS